MTWNEIASYADVFCHAIFLPHERRGGKRLRDEPKELLRKTLGTR